jgi:N-acetylmuramoyl-L-alanine amidase
MFHTVYEYDKPACEYSIINNLNRRDCMVVIVKRSNIILVSLIFFLAVMVYSLNVGIRGAVPANADNNKKTVMLDPGHGGEDPGAVSDYSGIRERI